jgi:pilus assembly protein Flp/PilA
MLREKPGVLHCCLLPQGIDNDLDSRYNGSVRRCRNEGGPMFAHREEGQGLTEYALLAVLLSIAALAVLVLIGPQVSTMFSQVNSAFRTAGT